MQGLAGRTAGSIVAVIAPARAREALRGILMAVGLLCAMAGTFVAGLTVERLASAACRYDDGTAIDALDWRR